MKDDNNTDSETIPPSLLDRPLPKGYSQEWTESLKKDPTKEEHDGISVLIFRLENKTLAVKTKSIQEIREISPIHKIPHKTNKILLGITNVQGELKLTVCLKALLEIKEQTNVTKKTNKPYSRILSIGTNKNDFVFIADEVYGISQIKNREIKPRPHENEEFMQNFTSGFFQFRNTEAGLLNDQIIIDTISKNYL